MSHQNKLCVRCGDRPALGAELQKVSRKLGRMRKRVWALTSQNAELRAEVERLTAERDAAREGIAVATETAQRAIDEVKRLREELHAKNKLMLEKDEMHSEALDATDWAIDKLMEERRSQTPKLPTPQVHANDGPTLDQRLDDASNGENTCQT